MDKEILNQWFELYSQKQNGYHMSEADYKELVRLNHLVMDATHEIHNARMLMDRLPL